MNRIFIFISSLFLLPLALCADKKNTENNQVSLNVSSYNMLFTFEKGHKSYTVEREKKWHKRKDTILQMVKLQNIDICGTQELRKLQIDYLFPDDTYNYVIAPKEYDPQQRLMNNLILYNFLFCNFNCSFLQCSFQIVCLCWLFLMPQILHQQKELLYFLQVLQML